MVADTVGGDSPTSNQPTLPQGPLACLPKFFAPGDSQVPGAYSALSQGWRQWGIHTLREQPFSGDCRDVVCKDPGSLTSQVNLFRGVC